MRCASRNFASGKSCSARRAISRNTRDTRTWTKGAPHQAFIGAGLYGEKVALIGMGAVARELVALL